jgi:hypothetical protein
MIFTEDKYYNRDVIYKAGEVYEVPIEMVNRWLKRGGSIVEEAPVEKKKPVTQTKKWSKPSKAAVLDTDGDEPEATIMRSSDKK